MKKHLPLYQDYDVNNGYNETIDSLTSYINETFNAIVCKIEIDLINHNVKAYYK